MAQIAFTPATVSRAGAVILLTDETASRLSLTMPDPDCAAIVYAAIRHNLPQTSQQG